VYKKRNLSTLILSVRYLADVGLTNENCSCRQCQFCHSQYCVL